MIPKIQNIRINTLIPLKIEILEEDLDKKTSPINIEVLLNACVDKFTIYNLRFSD